MSKHEALVVPVELKKHENSDHLSIVKVFDYTCVCRTEDWLGKTKAVYCEPDSLVDVSLPQFSFLAQDAKYTKESELGGSYARVRAKKLRGVQSYGVLIPAPDEAQVGEDYFEKWNMGRYEPPTNAPNGKWGFVTSGEIASAPPKHASLPKYDVEGALKWARRIFVEGENVVGTLKYHGSNGNWVYSEGEFYSRSRTEFKKEFASPPKADKDKLIEKLGEEKGLEVFNKIEEKAANWKPGQNLWWRVLRENECLQKFLKDNEDTVVYGEVIGVQGNKFLYGLAPGQVSYRVFDIYKEGKWLDFHQARELGKDLKWVKVIHEIPFNLDEMIKLTENMSVHENIGSYEEGIVWGGLQERWNEYIGRNKVKLINPKYLEKS